MLMGSSAARGRSSTPDHLGQASHLGDPFERDET